MDGASLTRNAAIALAGGHPIILTGGETANAAKELAIAMTKALPPLLHRELAEIQQSGRVPSPQRRRTDRTPPCVHAEPGDPILPDGKQPIRLAEMAHHGTLSASNVHRWAFVPLVELYVAAYKGITRDRKTGKTIRCKCRVIGDWTGCVCPDSAEHCKCTEEDREAADKTLWTDAARWIFDIECEGPDSHEQIDTDVLKDANRRAQIFRLKARNQHEANALVQPQPGRRGWQLTRAAAELNAQIQESPHERDRSMQLARTIADIDEKTRIDERHIAETERLSRHLRRHAPM